MATSLISNPALRAGARGVGVLGGCVANLERRRERASRSVGRSGGEQLKLLGQ